MNFTMRMLYAFLVALQFLTSLPVRPASMPDEKTLGHSLMFYPLVGLIIGWILALLCGLLATSPPLVAAAVLTASWILLTGGLHLDGLADSADAWIGGMGDSNKTLAIMKDPHCGAAGVTAVILLVLLKFAALHTLIIAQQDIVVIYAAVLARTLVVLLFLTTPYVRNQGLGTALANHQPYVLNTLVVTTTPVLLVSLTSFDYIWLLFAAAVIFLLLRWLMIQRIHGTTGDTIGALVEISELGIILTAVLWAMD